MRTDVFRTGAGDLDIMPLGHGSLMLSFGGTVVHIDPYSTVADYGSLPKADLVLITHEHADHLDLKALHAIQTEATKVVANAASATQLEHSVPMANGETGVFKGLTVTAVPAYNVFHHRPSGLPYHPKGNGNGYVIAFGKKRVYVAGDTENIPEMRSLGDVDIAFIPMNLPYTMTPEMAAAAAVMINPQVLYLYHYGDSDTGRLVELLKEKERGDMDVRISGKHGEKSE